MQPSEALADARAYIGEYSWRRSIMGQRSRNEAVCLIGSIPGTQLRYNVWEGVGPVYSYLAKAVYELHGLTLTVGKTAGGLHIWNDHYAKSQAQVVEVLEYAEKLAVCDEILSHS